jgi:hypothetical protein
MTHASITGLLAAALIVCGCASQPGTPGKGSGVPTSGKAGMPAGSDPSPSEPAAPSVATSSGAPGSAAPESGQGTSSTRAGGVANSPGSATPPTAQTPEERRASIDRRLNDSLGTFDAELKKERERVAQERDARSRAGSASSDEETSDETTDAEAESKEGEGSAETEGPTSAEGDADAKDADGKRPGDLKSERTDATTGANAKGGNGAGARKIPDGSDDDIVARRLRKAAEAETDPELKEKLWKEYIEYKKNTG